MTTQNIEIRLPYSKEVNLQAIKVNKIFLQIFSFVYMEVYESQLQ